MNDTTPKQRILAAAAHAGFYLGGLGFLVLPFLIKTIWSGDEFVIRHATQALYIQIGAFIVSLLVIPLAFVVSPMVATVAAIAILSIAWALFAIIAAIKAMSGEEYVYPALKLVHIC